MDESTFEQIHPSRYLTFTIPGPVSNIPRLHVAVLDSPFPTTDPLRHHHTSAMLVPSGRESDWTFSTREGHLQLLLGSPSSLSRLALISNVPDSTPQHLLQPLLFALCPKSAFPSDAPPRASFVSYEYDDGQSSSTVEIAMGPAVGEILVEDVQMGAGGEIRRRLRFRRMPNLVQSQVLLLPRPSLDAGSQLLQPYLAPMVASLSLIAPTLEKRGLGNGKVLCLGVGGGSLPMFLHDQLKLNVLAIEIDPVVLDLAKRHFGLVAKGDSLRLCVGDAIDLVDRLGCEKREFGAWKEKMGSWWWGSVGEIDAVMVDLDSCDPSNGIAAPPVEFARRSVVAGARTALRDGGILVVNVVPLEESRYVRLVELIGDVFSEVYEVEVGNEGNRVVAAAVSPVGEMVNGDRWVCPVTKRLVDLVGSHFVNSIQRRDEL